MQPYVLPTGVGHDTNDLAAVKNIAKGGAGG